MKQKGFTLVELLGVITILAVIALLAFPKVSKSISGGKQKLYKSQMESFKDAASVWMSKHILEIPNGTINTSITLGCLKSEGILEPYIENPLTGEPFPNDLTISIQSGSGQYIYTVNENSGSKGSEQPIGKCSFDSTLIDR